MELHLYANFLNNTPLDQLARMYDLAPWKVDDIIMKIKHDFAEPSKNMKTDERFQSWFLAGNSQ